MYFDKQKAVEFNKNRKTSKKKQLNSLLVSLIKIDS